MKYESYTNGEFSLLIRRYKNETNYETKFINTVISNFKIYSFRNISSAYNYLSARSKPYKSKSKGYALYMGSSSKYVGGSLASKDVKLKFKNSGSWVVQITESYLPDTVFE